ncbi:hypothetical protein EJB05_04630, partial [Eragrostis curvula]
MDVDESLATMGTDPASTSANSCSRSAASKWVTPSNELRHPLAPRLNHSFVPPTAELSSPLIPLAPAVAAAALLVMWTTLGATSPLARAVAAAALLVPLGTALLGLSTLSLAATLAGATPCARARRAGGHARRCGARRVGGSASQASRRSAWAIGCVRRGWAGGGGGVTGMVRLEHDDKIWKCGLHGIVRSDSGGQEKDVYVPLGQTPTGASARCATSDTFVATGSWSLFEIWRVQDYVTGSWSLDYRIDL